jgi:hypothetical protein
MVFRPQGFLVAILENTGEAERAKATLIEGGFADADLRIYTGQQILDDWERFKAERGVARTIVGALTDEQETLERYHGYARQGRAALWTHIPNAADVDGAMRQLADYKVLYFRYYGRHGQTDIHVEGP